MITPTLSGQHNIQYTAHLWLALRSLCLVLVAGCLSASAASAQSTSIGPAPYVAMAIGSSVDLATTLSALSSDRAVKEGNPFLAATGTPGLIAWKSGSTVGVLWIMRELVKAGHPRWARVVGYGGGTALALVGARNHGVGR